MIGYFALRDQTGSAAVEMVLLLPLLLVLLFVGFEGGHFIWTQQKLIESVRDGARFGARINVNEVCGGNTAALNAAKDRVKLLTRTGQLNDPDAAPRVPGWTAAEVDVTYDCGAFVATGIYTDLGGAGAIVRVTATGVTYPSLFGRLGLLTSSIRLTAKSNAPVVGL